MPQLSDYIFLFTKQWRDWPPEEINNVLIILLIFFGALALPARVWKIALPLEAGASRLARNRKLVIVLAGFLAVAVNAAISWWGQWPVPGTHDEFSYLLASDTFAHGRLTNPTPAI